MILQMKLSPPLVGMITVKTPFIMITENEKENTQDKYKIIYKVDKTYKVQYNVKSFEVLHNE